MATSLQAFRVGLFEEHLDEASFLYSQCRNLRAAIQTSWQTTAGFEQRLELHLDALVVGGELALQVCRRRAVEGDAGELFAAASVFCRHRLAPLLAQTLADTLARLDPEQPETLIALGDALKYELPEDWAAFVEQALRRPDARLVPPLATACGYRRIPCEDALCEALGKAREQAPLALVEALGRLQSIQAEPALDHLLTLPDDTRRAAALIALMRSGREAPLRRLYLTAQRESWPRLALGLGGDASAAHALMKATPSTLPADSLSLLALGLLGSPTGLRHLHEKLSDPALAEVAARALNWVTGANLFEGVFVAEAIDEDTLFPREIKAWRQYKQAPKAANGQPFGSTQRKLSTDPVRWRAWFSEHTDRFDARLRYRSGQPCSPTVLVATLAHPDGDPLLRQTTAHELAIRYGCHVPFEVDMPVVHQIKALRGLSAWANSHATSFQPGAWYFAGCPQTSSG